MAAVYGISACLYGAIPLAELVPKLSAKGWCQVELGFQPDPTCDWRADVDGARRLLDGAGISVPTVHVAASGWNLADPDESVRRTALAKAIGSLAPAAGIGARIVICHHNAPRTPFLEEDRAAGMARSRESLRELAECAADLGLQLAVENLPQRHTPRPGGPITDILEIIRSLGEHVGVCIDAGHSNANGISPAEEVRWVGDKLWAVHIQDNDGLGEDQHWVPGTGTTDWGKFIAALDEIAPDCVRTFEVGAKDAEPDDVLAEVTQLREKWSGM